MNTLGDFESGMGSSSLFSSGGATPGPSLDESAGANAELQDFIALEQQKQQLRAQIQNLTDNCWEKCMTGSPSSKMDSKTEACLENCVHRFFDVTTLITSRFAQLLQRQGGM